MNNKVLSRKDKNKKGKEWYKEKANSIDARHQSYIYNTDDSNEYDYSEYKRMKVNYGLFNNIIDLDELSHVCNPHGKNGGKMPVKMVNKDISSSKIKSILGMEMKTPFDYTVLALNSEATTRKEEKEFSMIRKYVVSEIMSPIREAVEKKYQQETKGRELTEEESQKIQEKIQQETKERTPQAVKKYMLRKHQDPAEVQVKQLISHLTQKLSLDAKFNKMLKHGLLSAKEIMYVGVLNGNPVAWNVNSMRFNSNGTSDVNYIEEEESASCEYRMTPSEISKYFGDELSKEDIEKIYDEWSTMYQGANNNDLFERLEMGDDLYELDGIRVVHTVWKAPRKLGYLYYMDENGKMQTDLVDETYELNEDAGDISIQWEYPPETHETWKIKVAKPIYLHMRPIPGQFKDIYDLYSSKLPYYGVRYDNMNSRETAVMDRLKGFQYSYNTVNYRKDLLLASNKGKKVLMNINVVPKKSGITMKNWQYYADATPYMWFDPKEEGSDYMDASNIAKVVDLSSMGDIKSYLEIMEKIQDDAGRAIGVTDNVEGQVGPREAVRNVQQNLQQTSNILEPYLELHSQAKRNILMALVEAAKVAYHGEKSIKLSYTTDDMTQRIFKLDIGLLNNTTLGIYLSNSAKAREVKKSIESLAHAALQNQRIEMSDIISTMKEKGITEAEESLRVAEQNKREEEMKMQREKSQAESREKEKERQREREKHREKLEEIITEEREKRKTKIIESSLMGASYNSDMDRDNDGDNDFIEIARDGLEADIRKKELALERDKFEHEKRMDKKENKKSY